MALCFADVDFLLKMSALHLLEEALDALDLTPADIRVTPALWHRLKSGRRSLVAKYGE